jgi:hypothetical protein
MGSYGGQKGRIHSNRGQRKWDSKEGQRKDQENSGFFLDTKVPSFYIQPTWKDGATQISLAQVKEVKR